MANATTVLANQVIDANLRGGAITPPASIWVALYTANPTPADSATEVSGGAYARQQVTLSAGSGGTTSNTNTITFPVATVAWGTITHYVIKNASSGGNGLVFGAFAAAKAIDIGDQLIVNIGDLDLTVD